MNATTRVDRFAVNPHHPPRPTAATPHVWRQVHAKRLSTWNAYVMISGNRYWIFMVRQMLTYLSVCISKVCMSLVIVIKSDKTQAIPVWCIPFWQCRLSSLCHSTPQILFSTEISTLSSFGIFVSELRCSFARILATLKLA